jgi:starch synthase
LTRSPLAGRTPRLGVLHIASEVTPWSKTGGLADVAAALPAALDALGHRSVTITPRYRGIDPAGATATMVPITMGDRTWQVTCWERTESPRRSVIFVDVPEWFDREGLYGARGVDHPDNALRFSGLCHAALGWAQASDRRFDIVHAHDWQAGPALALLRTRPQDWPRVARAGLVATIHNLAYQGVFPKDVVPTIGLDWSAFTMHTGEFWGQLSLLKLAIAYADLVTTVSPTYARETLTPEWGVGLDGALRARAADYVGILNGIDTSVWDPASDPYLAAPFTAEDRTGKRLNKRALLERVGLPVGDDVMERPLVGLVSRLVDQKGIDLIVTAADALLALDATWVFVGTGDARHEAALRALAARYPSRVATVIGFDEGLAHLVEAGADLFLMPSRFEPCGLNQMYSLRYGTVPVVRAVGGLDDSVRGYNGRSVTATGFTIDAATPEALVRTLRLALRTFRRTEVWSTIVDRGMREDHSWALSAREYVKVYRRARHAAAVRWGDAPRLA